MLRKKTRRRAALLCLQKENSTRIFSFRIIRNVHIAHIVYFSDIRYKYRLENTGWYLKCLFSRSNNKIPSVNAGRNI